MAETIKISIELADKAASKALSDFADKSLNADKNINKLGKSGKSSFNDIAVSIGKTSGIFDIFAGNLAANLVTGAFSAMKNAAGALFQTFIVDGIKAASEQEDALNSLNQALAMSGKFSEATSQRFQDFASKLQSTTTVGDEVILKNAALIQSLGNLDEQGLQRATEAAVNLSAALGIDLNAASQLVGKAAAGNVASFSRYGLQIQKGATDTETFNNTLKALEERFGGAAASKVNTYSGAIAQATNTFGDLQEITGEFITKNPALIGAINEISKIFGELGTEINGNKDGMNSLITETFVSLIDGAGSVAEAFDAMVRIFEGAYLVVAKTLNDMAFAGNVINGIFTDTSAAMAKQSARSKELAQRFEELGSKDTTLSRVRDAFTGIAAAAQKAADEAAANGSKIDSAYKNNTAVITETTEAQKKLNDENTKYAEGLSKQQTDGKAAYDRRLQDLQLYKEYELALEEEGDAVKFDQKIERERLFNERRDLLVEEQYVAEQEQLKLTREQGLIDKETYLQAQLTLEQNYSQTVLKNRTDQAKKEKAITDAQAKYEKQERERKIAEVAGLFGALGTLAATGGRKTFEIAKAFNLAEAITSGILAVQKAASALPFPANIPGIATMGALSAANVIRISQTRAPAFEQGGIVPGASFTGDRVMARVNSGEMILNKNQQGKLFDMANGFGGSDMREVLGVLRDIRDNGTSIQIDGREIINVTRNQLAAGRAF